jgi:hypothetical protein
MERTPIIFVTILAVIILLVFNLGIRHNYQETREISRYDYAKLFSVLDFNSEVPDIASDGLKHETVTIAEYNDIMRKIDMAKSRKELR